MPADVTAGEVAFEAIEVTTNYAGASETRLADVDDNGSVDVVGVAPGDGRVVWWENVDDNGTTWVEHPIFPAPDIRTLDTADLDTDGDVDVIVGSFSVGVVAWLENDGTGFGWTPRVISTEVEGPISVHVTDVDRDGRLDVVAAAQSEGVIYWWDNVDGDGRNWLERTITSALSAPSNVSSADIDEDGDTDIVLTDSDFDAVAWMSNEGGLGLSWSPNVISTDFGGATSVRVGDIDVDGDLDIVAAAADAGLVTWWSNDTGDGSVWSEIVIDPAFAGANAILIRDVDRDGDRDVISAGSTAGEIAWWENSDTVGNTWVKQTIDSGLAGPSDLAFGDIDADGDPDVLATVTGADSILWWDNLSVHRAGIFATQVVVNSDVPGASVVVAGDLDDDGDLDLVASASTGQDVRWWENQEDGELWTERIIEGGFNGALNVEIDDVDGDGDLDVLGAAQTDDRLAWWENAFGDGLTWIERTIVEGGNPPIFDGAFDIDTADIDGDGDIDVLGAAENADRISWFENVNGDGLTWVRLDIDDNADGARSADARDFDGDGDLDVIGAMNDANDITWWENFDGLGTIWVTRTIEGGFSGADMVAGGDIDRDGDIDVVAVGFDADDIKWWENEDGLGTTWTERTIEGNFDGATSILITDKDADSDLDILATAQNEDQVAWWENVNGDGLEWVNTFVSTDFDGAVWATVADINLDGQIDVAAAGTNVGDIRWWRNVGGQVSFVTRNEAPAAMPDGGLSDILSIQVVHEGREGDVDVEPATIRLLLEERTANPPDFLEDGEANALIESVLVYADDGSQEWEPDLDTLVATVGTLVLEEGEFTVTLPDNEPVLRVPVGEPKRIFIVVELTSDASFQEVINFQMSHLTGDSVVEDENDIVMINQGAPVVTSRNVRASGTVPVLAFSGPCPGPVTVTVSNATPARNVLVYLAEEQGNFVLQSGTCAGLEFDLDAPEVIATLLTNVDGVAIGVIGFGQNQCENFLQAQETSRCLPSNVVQLPEVTPPPDPVDGATE